MSVVACGDFLIPKKSDDKWAVVACDQYTSSPEYWEREKARIGDAPSTLDLICPEAFLGDIDARLPAIAAASEKYAASDIFEKSSGLILTKRTVGGVERYGLVCTIDLEKYTFNGKAPVRATEGTVLERIPPRLAVRRASRYEASHVLCLIDDEERTVVEPLIGKGKKLYEADLGAGGRLEGFSVVEPENVLRALDALESRAEKAGEPFILVGDGNHSLASAKALYEELKDKGDERAARARYATVEIENLRSDAVVFHPIHRILYNTDLGAEELCFGRGGSLKVVGKVEAEVPCPADGIETYRAVQDYIDDYISSHPSVKADYVHGEADLRALCEKHNAVGFVMPTIPKDTFFGYVSKHGRLPRKTFSLGQAWEKRYYYELREIGRG